MANFEAFCRNILSSTNLKIGRSDIQVAKYLSLRSNRTSIRHVVSFKRMLLKSEMNCIEELFLKNSRAILILLISVSDLDD